MAFFAAVLTALALFVGAAAPGFVAGAIAAIQAEAFAIIIGAILGTGGIGAILGARATSKRTDAEARDIAANTLRDVIGTLREELHRVESENSVLRERVAILEHRLDNIPDAPKD